MNLQKRVELTAGITFAIIAFRFLLSSGEKLHPPKNEDHEPVSPLVLALKIILNPYACATLIVLLASSQSAERTVLIFTMLIINLILDAVALKYIRIVMGKIGQITMQILGAVLGVMQAALAVTIIFTAWTALT